MIYMIKLIIITGFDDVYAKWHPGIRFTDMWA